MKRGGNINVILSIEKCIVDYGNYRCIKDGAGGLPPVRDALIEPALYSKIYEVYDMPYMFTICLRYDYRFNYGRFEVMEKNVEMLYSSVPGLVEQVAKLRPLALDGKSNLKLNVLEGSK